MEGTETGVTPASPAATPTTTPAATGDTMPQPASPATPSASEGVTPPAPAEDQHVPYDRFKEVNDRAKQSADELEKAQQRIAELEAASSPADDTTDQLDPDVQKVLDGYMKNKGFVTQEELAAEKTRLQAESDVRELKSEFTDFDETKVLDFAKENGLLINDKAGLRSIYQMMKSSDPSFKEGIKNELLAELKDSGQLAGPALETPGPGGAAIGGGEKPTGTRNILRAAIQRNRS